MCKRRYTCLYIVEIPILLAGLIIYGIYNEYDLYNGIVIQTEYQKMLCSCKLDCSENSQNGCVNYCQNNKKFECSQLNINILIKENTQCSVTNLEKGFDYTYNNQTWYNSEYSIYYKLYNIGDTYNIYYNKKCMSIDSYKSHMGDATVCIIFSCVSIFVFHCCTSGKKREIKVIPNKNEQFSKVSV